jgi:hypothetical protein
MQREPMKQAVRENRRGKVRVADQMLLDRAPEVALLRSRMDVFEEPHDAYTRSVWFVGYAPEFDELELGEQAPEYDAILTYETIADPPPPVLTFRRRVPAAPHPELG